ncbi:MAG: YebC/PmpR family DNA-binding transcriptional regulator [Candidatus Zambryskibacteria bacterium]|nr:YebC/PmpR family DNA-binding transcriptional regulator [Candidatus Zambryskibacteria bacterium]
MSGHNKWSKIKNKKAITDAAKSKIFSKMARLISIASKQAKGDITSPVLRAAIEKAREYNMPADNIERATKKGSGVDALSLEAITYEAYGPGGSALVIEALTDNRNKAAQEIKFILSKHGFSLAAPGSAIWAFKKDPATNNLQPITTTQLLDDDEKKLETLIEELEDNDEVQDVYTNAI